MRSEGVIYDKMEGVLAKLHVLRDSCTGVIHKEDHNPNLIWFQGAEAILREGADELQKSLRALQEGS